MTVKFRKKVRKQRGYTSHGWGSKKKHRGGGSRGGRGLGGSQKHKFSFVTTKDPDRFGYKGFYSRRSKTDPVNVGDVEKMSGEHLNLTEMGYGKLLGKGKITRAVTVTVGEASKRAKEKIESAGGKLVTSENPKKDSKESSGTKPDNK